ncbi:uncharacterized protein LOC108676659 [Hyalella azteca]|uniref:Uncharacterized protein LOC108676659 n=1 Tax=Hyalella azteca TaxID=294128 RepID=A0A8B7P2S2_HYAAZ|nr:uncharacterized protein LOC108676659 [Hyalella azteca]
MNRGLLLLVVAATSVSAQTVPSTCANALYLGLNNLTFEACQIKYSTAVASFNTNCANFMGSPGYNGEVCDPIVFDYMKCVLKTSGLLKADGSFDDAAFKKTNLQNKCSSDAKFSTVYQPCRDSTMKYLNLPRFIICLMKKLEL